MRWGAALDWRGSRFTIVVTMMVFLATFPAPVFAESSLGPTPTEQINNPIGDPDAGCCDLLGANGSGGRCWDVCVPADPVQADWLAIGTKSLGVGVLGSVAAAAIWVPLGYVDNPDESPIFCGAMACAVLAGGPGAMALANFFFAKDHSTFSRWSSSLAGASIGILTIPPLVLVASLSSLFWLYLLPYEEAWVNYASAGVIIGVPILLGTALAAYNGAFVGMLTSSLNDGDNDMAAAHLETDHRTPAWSIAASEKAKIPMLY
jgi:hypothetical protein